MILRVRRKIFEITTFPNTTAGAPPKRVSTGSTLTGASGASASDPEEQQEEEEEPPAMRLGSQEELTLRRETGAGAAGYSSGGSLPPSRCSRTAWSVRPRTPHHKWRPSLL